MKEKDSNGANELVKHYNYLVTFHVERIATNLPSNVNKDDLESFALMGLFDALNKFEPERNLKFDTYASFRIRGSIIDGLRKEDWLPRSIREKTKEIEEVSQRLEQENQRSPSAGEIAAELGITTTEVETIIRDSLVANILSIERKPTNSADEFDEGIGYTVPDEASQSPEEHVLNTELKAELSEQIRTLNTNEQLVISLFYDKELTMTEIGEVLSVTTSRISQIHKSALFKLRKALQHSQERA